MSINFKTARIIAQVEGVTYRSNLHSDHDPAIQSLASLDEIYGNELWGANYHTVVYHGFSGPLASTTNGFTIGGKAVGFVGDLSNLSKDASGRLIGIEQVATPGVAHIYIGTGHPKAQVARTIIHETLHKSPFVDSLVDIQMQGIQGERSDLTVSQLQSIRGALEHVVIKEILIEIKSAGAANFSSALSAPLKEYKKQLDEALNSAGLTIDDLINPGITFEEAFLDGTSVAFLEALEFGSSYRDDGYVDYWVDDDGSVGRTSSASNYTSAQLEHYGHVTENGAARLSVGDHFRSFADQIGLDGQIGIQGSFSSENDGTGASSGKPVILDLDGDGVEISSAFDVSFDWDEDGYLETGSWAAADDGFLVIDLAADGSIGTGDGVIDQARELAFGLWGPEGATDLQALAQATDGNGNLIFDSNGDGVLNSSDALWSSFNVWQDVNQNGITDDGELLTLASLGITSINLTYDDGTTYSDTDDDITVFGNTLHGLASFVQNGELVEGGVGDVSLAYNAQGYRRVETALGYDIEFESGELLRYAELDGTGSADVNLVSEWLDGAAGDDRANVLDATGHTNSVQVSGGAGNDTITGGHLDDMLSGDDGADALDGGGGNDLLFVDQHDTLIQGGDGYDTAIFVGEGAINLDMLGASIESAYGGDGNDIFSATSHDSAVSIYGGAGVDTLTGGAVGDILSGDDGDDIISGLSGGDTLLGGAGADTLHGDNGDDFLLGGEGNDVLVGGLHDDVLLGGAGDDNLSGGNNDDTLNGGDGDDFLNGGLGDDRLLGGVGDDTLQDLNGDNSLFGGDGNDQLTVGVGNSLAEGGDGNDILTSQGGATILRGEAGDDRFYQATFGSGNWVQGGIGDDTLVLNGTSTDWTVSYEYRDERLSGGTTFYHLRLTNGTTNVRAIDVETVEFTGDDVSLSVSYASIDSDNSSFVYAIENDGTVSWAGDHLQSTSALSSLNGTQAVFTYGGADAISAGVGNDVVYGGNGADRIDGETGNDDLYGQDGSDVLQGGAGSDSLSGGSGDDYLSGGEGIDTLTGGNGSDSLYGGDGDDVLAGQSGSDLLSGNDGNDRLWGGGADDSLFGGLGDDQLYGGNDDDYLSGGADNDVLRGEAGNDTLLGDSGDDTLIGGAGFDILDGGTGNDTLSGGDYDDQLFGDSGNDLLNGDAGNDVLFGGTGADTFNGGDGIDTAGFGNLDAAVVANLAIGEATSLFNGVVETDLLLSIENLSGTDFDDELRGDSGHNSLAGGDGSDSIHGGAGNDTVYGGDGADRLFGDSGIDVLIGGDGNDDLNGGSGADQLVGGEGIDRVIYSHASSGVIVDLMNSHLNAGQAEGDTFDSIENIYGSTFNDVLGGDAEDNVVWGRAGNDSLEGRDGNDILLGGAGADVLDGGHGIDRASYVDASSGVLVDLRDSSLNTGDANGDVYISIENLIGSTHNDSLRGDNENNTIWGHSGNDLLFGYEGNDRLVGGSGNDRLFGQGGNDQLNGGAGSDSFEFGLTFENDVVQDFEDNVDQLMFHNLGLSDASDALSYASQIEADVVFDFGDGDTLTVRNTTTSALIDDIVIG